jgi:GAF domain-containing protein
MSRKDSSPGKSLVKDVRRLERAADSIRESGGYRWVGIYEVGTQEISILAWSGGGPPAHLRFPRDRGLCGAAAASGSTLVVNDVSKDPRYLTTFGSTRAEIVVPVRNEAGEVVALIDVESGRRNAFTPEDVSVIERFASDLSRSVPRTDFGNGGFHVG